MKNSDVQVEEEGKEFKQGKLGSQISSLELRKGSGLESLMSRKEGNWIA